MATSVRVQIAMTYLEEAVLDVLLKAKEEGCGCLGPAEVSHRTGIYRGSDRLVDAIAAGTLNSLEDRGLVARCTQPNGRGGWKISF